MKPNLADIRLAEAVPLDGFRVRMRFSDDTIRTLDLGPLLHGPAFTKIAASRTEFLRFRVEDGTLAWPSGADLDPLVLYCGGRQQAAEWITAHGTPAVAEDRKPFLLF